MKMLFVATTSATAWAFILPIAKYERERGHQVEFACSFENFKDAPVRIEELQEEGFVVHEISFAREIEFWQDLKTTWLLSKLIRKNKYDLVHTYTSKAGFIGRLAGRIARCPHVIHTVLSFAFQPYDSGLKKQLYILLEKLAAPLCDRLLFISECNLKEAIQYRLKSPDKMDLVGLSFDSIAKFKDFQVDVAAVRAKYGIQPDELLVGTVGRLVFQKGMDTLIQAAALVLQQRPEIRFVIAGDGELRQELEQLTQKLGIADRVKFLGFITEIEEVMSLIASLDLFVLSTRFEGLGLVYLEAMALQRPVVGSRISPVTEVVKDGETGLLANVDDPEDFATAMLKLLDNPQLRQQMGTAGPNHVESEYSWQKVLERVDRVYQELQKI
ncbi:MAG: glycosyltransferase family 4 protein [Xenococcaceae cyanobacterium]